MLGMNQYNQNKAIRTELKFSVSMVVIATVAILTIGSTATMAMAHHDHHHGGSGMDTSGQSNGNSGSEIVNGVLRYCIANFGTCASVLGTLLG
jgi:hypothetical protein